MNNTTSEPPGCQTVSIQASIPASMSVRRPSVISLPSPRALNGYPPLHREYASVESMVHALRPELPVQCLRPATIEATARRFLKAFPGDVLYAVKTNPDLRVLTYLAQAGVKHFDVASLVEAKLVAEALPEAHIYFMHPVKSREAIEAAYYEHGIRDFSLDSHEELGKILEVTGHASDLNLYVRLAMPSEGAVYSLAGKFGIGLEQAASLLIAARKAANRLGICFHVGSQCMNPNAYGLAIQTVADLLAQIDVRLDVLDIGGGFPSLYPGLTPPPLGQYMKSIKKALKSHPSLVECQLLCEPGRALVAEGGSIVARVELRKGNMLYLNDGVYGSLFDAGVPGFVFPVKAIRPDSLRKRNMLSNELMEFGFFGPTCDSLDAMKGPFHLPADIAEGDWIEIGQLGAYGATMRTNFNGFYSDLTVEVADKPLLSMLEVN